MAKSCKDPEIMAEVRHSQVHVPWCDEFEKMLSGMPFSAAGIQELSDHKLKVMRMLQSFNDPLIRDQDTLASLTANRMAVAGQLLGKIGEHVKIEPPFFVTWGCTIFLGDQVYINREVSIYDNAPVHIGSRVLIGPGVCICTGTHATDAASRRQASGTSFALPIRIEDDCWIGARATILPGVRIGRGATVAAGAVVTRDVPPSVAVGGVPAKFLRSLQDPPSE